MRKETRIVTKDFDCSRCGKVTFKVEEIRHFVDEVPTPIEVSYGDILAYGACQAQKQARVPGHGTHDELLKCPVYQELE